MIEYYKGIFTILSSCASRQLEEVTFRRTVIPVQELLDAAGKYFKKLMKNRPERIELEIEPMEAKVIGDVNQLRFLLENLIDEALTVREDGVIRLQARKDNEYIRFLFTDTRREKSVEELNQLFYPNLARMTSGEKGELRGTEYLVCKQIIRTTMNLRGVGDAVSMPSRLKAAGLQFISLFRADKRKTHKSY